MPVASRRTDAAEGARREAQYSMARCTFSAVFFQRRLGTHLAARLLDGRLRVRRRAQRVVEENSDADRIRILYCWRVRDRGQDFRHRGVGHRRLPERSAGVHAGDRSMANEGAEADVPDDPQPLPSMASSTCLAERATIDDGPWALNKPGTGKSHVEIYDPASNSWTTGQAAPMSSGPSTRAAFTAIRSTYSAQRPTGGASGLVLNTTLPRTLGPQRRQCGNLCAVARRAPRSTERYIAGGEAGYGAEW